MQHGAFLSYARADQAVAGRLARELEAFRTPRVIVDTTGVHGLVPPRIELSTSKHSKDSDTSVLEPEVLAALRAADVLIVLCSDQIEGCRALPNRIIWEIFR